MRNTKDLFSSLTTVLILSVFVQTTAATRPTDHEVTKTDPAAFAPLWQSISSLKDGSVAKDRAMDQIRRAMKAEPLRAAGVPDPTRMDDAALAKWAKGVKLAKLGGARTTMCTLSFDTASGTPVKINIPRGAPTASPLIDALLKDCGVTGPSSFKVERPSDAPPAGQ